MASRSLSIFLKLQLLKSWMCNSSTSQALTAVRIANINLPSYLHKVVRRHTEFLHDLIARCAHAKMVNANHLVGILVPQPSDTSLHGYRLHAIWQSLRFVSIWLA